MVRQERALKTRQKILEAAADVFDRSGFAGSSVSDILEQAGVTKGALYFHFPSKEAIAAAIEGAELEMLAPAVNQTGPFLQTIVDLTYLMARHLRESAMVRASIRLAIEASFTSPASGPYAAAIELVRTLLLRGQGEGTVRLDLDVDAAARLIISSFAGAQIVSQVFTGREDLNQRLEEMWGFLLPGLVVPEQLDQVRLTPPPGTPSALAASAAS